MVKLGFSWARAFAVTVFIPLSILTFNASAQPQMSTAQLAAPQVNAALSSFIQKLEHVRTMQAHFVQTTRDQNQRTLQQLEGTLKVARPGKMHWQTLPPFSQEVVSDGELVWVYDHDLEQVTIRNMEQRLQDTPALLLSGNSQEIDKNFIVTLEKTGAISRYSLTPKDNSQLFEHIDFQYRHNDLESMRIYDAAGQTTDIVFSDVKVNAAISEQEFTFIVPEGVDVIDARHAR